MTTRRLLYTLHFDRISKFKLHICTSYGACPEDYIEPPEPEKKGEEGWLSLSRLRIREREDRSLHDFPETDTPKKKAGLWKVTAPLTENDSSSYTLAKREREIGSRQILQLCCVYDR